MTAKKARSSPFEEIPGTVPPGSLLRVIKKSRKTPEWRVGTEFRVGYYSPLNGLIEVQLVDKKGLYCDTVMSWDLNKHFEIVKATAEFNYFGFGKKPLGPL
jgi:hypothetical protein